MLRNNHTQFIILFTAKHGNTPQDSTQGGDYEKRPVSRDITARAKISEIVQLFGVCSMPRKQVTIQNGRIQTRMYNHVFHADWNVI
jgi:hypothetical protein